MLQIIHCISTGTILLQKKLRLQNPKTVKRTQDFLHNAGGRQQLMSYFMLYFVEGLH